MKDIVFYLGFGTLSTHELDAIINHEWRIIPFIRALPEDTGMIVFVVAHIPIFALLLALISSNNSRIRRLSRLGFVLFLVLHGILHILFKAHAAYEFESLLSNILIYGGAFLGILYLILTWNERSLSPT